MPRAYIISVGVLLVLQSLLIVVLLAQLARRRRIEVELRASETHSRAQLDTALAEFAATIGHEIRQPLTAIMMNARSCLRGLAAGTSNAGHLRASLLDVIEASQRAEQVIQRYRELFRHHTVQTTSLDINGVVGEAIALAAPRLRESGVTTMTALATDLPDVNGDRIELQQVLLNLIANAIDAMDRVEPHARRIDIATSRRDRDAVIVAVTDRGIGLANVDVPRMFTLSYTTKAAGTGVGLSISRSIVEAHGGRLWAEQNPDRGATLRFSLPVQAAMPVELRQRAV